MGGRLEVMANDERASDGLQETAYDVIHDKEHCLRTLLTDGLGW